MYELLESERQAIVDYAMNHMTMAEEALALASALREDQQPMEALKIAERLAMIGCSSQDNLPYFNAADHLAAL